MSQQHQQANSMEEQGDTSQPAPPPPQSVQQQQNLQQEPVNFNPSYGRRVTIGGMHGSGPIDRRGSLASVGMDDLFGRRPSMGFDVNNMDLFARRDSMDSTAAALDAAFLDLTRRRSSLFLGPGGPPGSDVGYPPSHQDPNFMRASLGGAAPPGFSPSSGMGPAAGMRNPGFNPPGYERNPSLSSFNVPNLPPPTVPSQQDPVGTIAARQKQLQQQQRELEQYQKVLEIQRQQLLANMQERSYDMPVPPQGRSPMSRFGGSMGFGSQSGSMSLGGSLALGSVHSQGSHGSSTQPQQHRSSGNQNWWICQICNAKAFSSREEATTHERVCQEGRRGDPMQPLQMQDTSQRSFSMGMDGSGHSAQSAHSFEPTAMMSSGPFAMLPSPMPLAMPSDKDFLTALHCFVRAYCVEVFTATEQDVATPSKGKRKPIQVGQIGIRCPHCHSYDPTNQRSRERGSVYYPTTISSIYNATMNLLQRHLHSCPAVPEDIMRRYETLKADDARSGTSKRYWVESALSLGLVDTPNGIRYSALRPPPLPSLTPQQASTGQEAVRRNSNEFFSSKSNAVTDAKNAQDASGQASKNSEGDAAMPRMEQEMADSAPLVTPDDKPYATTFSYHLLSQMQPCVFTEADRLGKRKGLPPGFPGLACRHCFGGYGSGRFFPSSIKTLSDTSKTLNVLHNHMMRCRKCPAEVRETLEKLRSTHDEERAKMKFGSQKAFFARIWERLHGKNQPPSFKRPLAPAPNYPPQGMHTGPPPGYMHSPPRPMAGPVPPMESMGSGPSPKRQKV